MELIKDKKRTDILVYDQKNACRLIIEVKRPEDSASDPGIVKQAFDYAQSYRSSGLKYFATHNGSFVIFWDALTGRKVDQFTVTYLTTLEEYLRKTDEIRESFRRVLRWYARFLEGEPPKPIDEGIIEILHGFIQGIVSATGLVGRQADAYVKDPDYRKRFGRWLLDKGWEDPKGDKQKLEEYCVILAKQFLYIYTNKVLFYNVLRERNPGQLPAMELPGGLTSDNIFTFLDTYFRLAITTSKDYETVFQTNFVDRIPIPQDAIAEIVKATDYLNNVEYSSIGYDIIGRVFEKLIPREERHLLGQYFTRSDVVDLILGFCLREPSSTVLDPACGTGTFLVRAYYRLRYLEGRKTHSELLKQLWGVDIDKFPAHLSTINLAIRDLSVGENYPNVVYGDFFEIPGPKTSVRIGMQPTLATWTEKGSTPKVEVTGLDTRVFEREIPLMDCVVGNPPYTRQEEMGAEFFGEKYKGKTLKVAKADFPDITLSSRASIYAYFFPHGAKFLGHDNSRLGFVCLRSWLDTRYGAQLQKFFLEHFKIVAVVESDEERWFPDAQMLPCIVILQVCNSASDREDHVAKFVRLKAPLSNFVPPIADERDMVQEIHRWKTVDSFTETVEKSDQAPGTKTLDFLGKQVKVYEDDAIRVVSVGQRFLKDDLKWGKYLAAPSVFFKVLEAGAPYMVPLNKVAYAKDGVKTGANEFFTVPNKYFKIRRTRSVYELVDRATEKPRFQIESNYLKPVFIKIKPQRTIRLTTPDGLLLVAHENKRELSKNGSRLLEYIEYGEKKELVGKRGKFKGVRIIGYHSLPTCKNREPWYDLGSRKQAPLIFPSIFWGRYMVFLNQEVKGFSTAGTLFEVHPNTVEDTKVLCALLNSTLAAFMVEFSGRYIENRDKTISNQVKVYEIQSLPVIDPSKLTPKQKALLEDAIDPMLDKPMGLRSLFTPEDMKAKEPLDKIVFCDILGLSKPEMDYARQALAEIVRGRVERFLPEKSEEAPKLAQPILRPRANISK